MHKVEPLWVERHQGQGGSGEEVAWGGGVIPQCNDQRGCFLFLLDNVSSLPIYSLNNQPNII